MDTVTIQFHLHPKAGCDIIDITEQIRTMVREHHIQEGIVQVFTPHTTTAIRINENDPGLLQDFKANLQRTIPTDVAYEHNKIDARQNARAHLASLLYGASESIPIHEGELTLGQWQSVFFIDFDGGRPEGRRVIVTVV